MGHKWWHWPFAWVIEIFWVVVGLCELLGIWVVVVELWVFVGVVVIGFGD